MSDSAMRLQMRTTVVGDVRFAGATRLADGVLEIDRDELRALVLEDAAFEDVSLDIVRPGDSVRIIHAMDAAEPRSKPDPASTFPAFVGPPRTVGEGTTHRLAGVAVLTASEAVAGEPTYWREAVVDMAGPGAALTAFGTTTNLVLTFRPHPSYLDASRPDALIENIMVGSSLAQRYNRSVRVAELKTAAYLARTAAGREADAVRTYELTPAPAGLPRVVYFYQLSGATVYGKAMDGMLPTLIHPNEVLDGAVVNVRSNVHASNRTSTFANQQHGVIEELYTRHGRDLDFRGVIVYPAASDDVNDKELLAEYAVKLARLLGADAACASYAGGGHPAVEFMLICRKCERAGIRTVLVMPEIYGTPDDPGFVYFVPEAERIVSTGRTTQLVELPAVDRVIGGEAFFDLPGVPGGAQRLLYRYLLGCGTSAGNGRLTARTY
jgi:glycine reductase complex component B subunit alpha and beta